MQLTTEQVKENIKAIKKQGGNESVIDSYINQLGFSSEYRQKYEEIKAFQETPVGKFLETSGKVLQAGPSLLGFSKPKTMEERLKESYFTEVKGESKIKQMGKEVLEKGVPDALAMTQLMTSGVGTPLKTGAKSLLKYGAKQAGIQGGLGTLKRTAEGESVGKALEGGIKEGAMNVGAIVGLPVVTKLIKESGKALLKGTSQVRNFAIEYALENPDVITTPQPSIVETGEAILNTLDDFADNIKKTYRERFDALPIPEGEVIDTNTLLDVMEKRDIDPEKLMKILKGELNNQASMLSEDALERFVLGDKVSFDEAKKINSFLFSIVDDGAPSAMGAGPKSAISAIKKNFLNLIDDSVEGMKDLNKFYAENTEFYKKIRKDISKKSGDLRENALNVMGQRKTGLGTAGRTKSQEINRVEKLDEIMGTNHIDNLTKSLVNEEFERIGMTNLMGLARSGWGGVLGGTLGSAFGGPSGAFVGGLMGAGASEMASKPQVARKAIELSTKIKTPKRLLKLSKFGKPLRAGLLSNKEGQ